MSSLLLVGGGGHCRSCIDVIEAQGRYAVAGIVQPHDEGTKLVLGYPVLGADEDLPGLLTQHPNALVTVGQIKTPEVRIRLFAHLKQLRATLPVIVSSMAHLSRHAQVDEGTIIMHGAIVNAGARVGRNVIVNSQALIEHDAVIGPHCHISTGARVNGGARVGTGSFVGSGAILREGVVVGSNSVIGAGQLILRDLPSNSILRCAT